MGHSAGCQCGVRSQHGRCAGGISSAARSRVSRGLRGRDIEATDQRNACSDQGQESAVVRLPRWLGPANFAVARYIPHRPRQAPVQHLSKIRGWRGLAVHRMRGLTLRRVAEVAFRYRGAGTAPSTTWRFRIDAVPHTVLGTRAGTIVHVGAWLSAHHDALSAPAVSVCPLPRQS